MFQNELVSVIMTNYNTPEDYLRQAIESILNQTYSNFEFIIVDDASTDDSLLVIESYNDNRIIILKNEVNIGLTKSLNKALDICKGEFIARMDSDDISEPERFEKQVRFLKDNSNVIVCGTWVKMIGDWKTSHTNEYITRTIPDRETFSIYQLFSNNPNIVHPSAMFIRELLLRCNIRYDERYIYSQDYRMWISCNRYSECAIVPEVLLQYRVHKSAITVTKKDIQNDCVYRIIQEQLDLLHLTLPEELKQYHLNLLTSRKPFDLRIKKWMKEIINANKTYQQYNKKFLKKILMKKWAEICYFGLIENNNRMQILWNLNIRYYPYLINLFIQRKRKRNNG